MAPPDSARRILNWSEITQAAKQKDINLNPPPLTSTERARLYRERKQSLWKVPQELQLFTSALVSSNTKQSQPLLAEVSATAVEVDDKISLSASIKSSHGTHNSSIEETKSEQREMSLISVSKGSQKSDDCSARQIDAHPGSVAVTAAERVCLYKCNKLEELLPSTCVVGLSNAGKSRGLQLGESMTAIKVNDNTNSSAFTKSSQDKPNSPGETPQPELHVTSFIVVNSGLQRIDNFSIGKMDHVHPLPLTWKGSSCFNREHEQSRLKYAIPRLPPLTSTERSRIHRERKRNELALAGVKKEKVINCKHPMTSAERVRRYRERKRHTVILAKESQASTSEAGSSGADQSQTPPAEVDGGCSTSQIHINRRKHPMSPMERARLFRERRRNRLKQARESQPSTSVMHSCGTEQSQTPPVGVESDSCSIRKVDADPLQFPTTATEFIHLYNECSALKQVQEPQPSTSAACSSSPKQSQMPLAEVSGTTVKVEKETAPSVRSSQSTPNSPSGGPLPEQITHEYHRHCILTSPQFESFFIENHIPDENEVIMEARNNSVHQKITSNTVITIDDDDDDENFLPVSNMLATTSAPAANTLAVASTSKTSNIITPEISKSATPQSIQASLRDLIINLRKMSQKNITAEIHKIFALCYKYNNENGTIMYFKLSVARNLFTKVFYRWEGWDPKDSKYKLNLQTKTLDLYNTLMANLAYIGDHLDNSIKQVVYEDIQDSEMTIYCSLKSLKTFFNNEPTKCKSYYNVTIPPTINSNEVLEPETIVNWPYVTIKISLPGFEMIHGNKNTCNFKIVNLKKFKGLKKGPKRSMNLRIKDSHGMGGSVFVHKLMAYLHRLKKCVAKDIKLQSKRKYNLYTVLTELENDVSSCVNDIITGCEYNLNLSPYSYLRYLGRPYLQNIPHKTMADQLSIKDENGLNIRLLEIVYPVVSFTLNSFTLSDLAPELFDLYYEGVKNNCLIYQCSFCSVSFDSYIAQYEMIHHLQKCHGMEPDWICSNCSTSFSTKDLSSCRWHHACL